MHCCMAMQVGSLIDMHQYVGPNAPLPTLTRAAVLGEFGGLGLRLEGHQLVPRGQLQLPRDAQPC